MEEPKKISEGTLIFLVGLVQFVNILDFMMVMPMGPDLARALGMSTGRIGLIGGAYTFSASIAGLIAALFLDSFSRKKALLAALFGLTVATFTGALVWNMNSMLLTRVIAGAFGGPLSSLSLSLVADYVPPERRGRAMGKVMGAFSAASVLGVPFGLELAHRFDWRAPFLVTGCLGVSVILLVLLKLPFHPASAKTADFKKRAALLLKLIDSKPTLLAYSIMGLTMFSSFMIVPNVASHLQLNLGYPREDLGVLYLIGGAITFFTMRLTGVLVDRYSAVKVSIFFAGLFALSIYLGFIEYSYPIPVIILFVCFMVSTTGRSVCGQTVASKIPAPQQRASFMSVQSSVVHMACALGAYYSSCILSEKNGKLMNMSAVGVSALLVSLIIPFLFSLLSKKLVEPVKT